MDPINVCVCGYVHYIYMGRPQLSWSFTMRADQSSSVPCTASSTGQNVHFIQYRIR